jgi:hypothetical protein
MINIEAICDSRFIEAPPRKLSCRRSDAAKAGGAVMTDASGESIVQLQVSPFMVALAELKRAYADLAALDAAVPEPTKEKKQEKAVGDALEALRAAEWTFLRTQAARLIEIRERAMVVQEMLNRTELMGPPTDNVDRLMFDTLVCEILGPEFRE